MIRRAVFLPLLWAASGFALPAARAAEPPGKPPPAFPEFVRGIALGLHASTPDYDYGPLVREIAAAGANWISLAFNWTQSDLRSADMAPPFGWPALEESLRETMRAARRARLKTLLFPVVTLRRAGPGEWRGKLAPESRDAWFAAYGAAMERLARLAESEGAAAVSIGSELASLEGEREAWTRLASMTRRRSGVRILYSANWDHYERTNFWDAVDAVGISGYFELSKAERPAAGELQSAWEGHRDRLLAWRAKHWPEKPLIFTELGYPNHALAHRRPWDYTLKAPPAPGVQADCYRAFMRAWDGRAELNGVFFYDWFGRADPEDPGYSPRGKPAAALIREWFAARTRPEATRPR